MSDELDEATVRSRMETRVLEACITLEAWYMGNIDDLGALRMLRAQLKPVGEWLGESSTRLFLKNSALCPHGTRDAARCSACWEALCKTVCGAEHTGACFRCVGPA